MRLRAVLAAAALAAAASWFGAVPAGAGQAELGISITLAGMSPRLITADGPGVLTVVGSVHNDGERTIQGLDVRVQRGDPLATEADLQAALSGDATTDTVRPRFTDLPDALPPGRTAQFTVTVSLRGGGPLDSLQVPGAGVYPLLVNLNGEPDFGGRARLAAVRMLLPVLGLPAQGELPAVAPVAAAEPTPLTILWPLVDVPRLVPTADDQPVVLRDDGLAQSLAPGGRLAGLVRAAQQYAPIGSPLAGSLCFAVDPDLVQTVQLMAAANGYRLPNGAAGTGQEAALSWLRGVRELLAGRCVLALPMADVDLVALSRAGLTDLQGRARTDGAQILRDVLGVNPITELAWPAGELLDERTLTDLASLGVNATLLDPHGLVDPERAAGQAVVGLATGAPATASVRGILVDALTSQALSNNSRRPQTGSVAVPASTSPAGTDKPLSAQDGLATLAFRAATRGAAGLLLAPPRRWSAAQDEAGELLRTAGQLITAGWARPRDLSTFVGSATPQSTANLNYPVTAGAAEVSRSLTVSVDGIREQVRDLESATKRDPRLGYDPARLLDPIRFELLRACSTGWRGDLRTGEAVVRAADDRLAAITQSVQIEPPAGPYLLAASNSPLLLNLTNPLPVQIDVQITLSPVAGLRIGQIEVISLPAGNRRQIRVPAEVIRAGQFSVEAQLHTPGGTPLGPRGAGTRVQLRSTAYGTVTLVITGGAAVALVLLAGLRITRRVRAARTPAGEAHE